MRQLVFGNDNGGWTMTKTIYVNLAVDDLAAATRFYEAIGCTKNPQFSDGNAASMVWSDTITFQLLTREYFRTFTTKPLSDAHRTCAALFALSHDSRDRVDAIIDAASAAGGKADVRACMDMGWLYNRAVEDPDGNILELVWMDVAAMVTPEPESVVGR
jgi:predicted lactoylglutathione lyase